MDALKILSFCCLPLFATAQVVLPVTHLPFGEKKAGVTPEVLILKDHSQTITLHQAWDTLMKGAFQNMADFEKPGKFEFGQYHYWMAFVLENRSENPLDLVVQSPGRDSFWIKKKGDGFQAISFPRWFPAYDYLGKLPYKTKEINTFQVQPLQRDTLLFKLDHIRQFRIFVPLLSEVEAYTRQQLEATQSINPYYLFFIGATFMVMLFSAAQYVQQRDPVFLWYSLYLFSLIFVAWRIVEDLNPPFYLTYHFLPWSWTKVFHSTAHFVTYTLFIYHFLKQDDEFPEFMRPILRFVLGVSGVACLIELIMLGGDLRYQGWLLYYIFRTVMTLFSFVFLFLLWRERNRLAQIILVGTLCAITGELISLFLTAPFSTFAGAIGVSSEIIFLTGGLAYRARLFREAHYRLQNEHIAQLEENVRLREIEKKEEVEAFKNLFYANITHEFRTPLTVILGMSESLRESPDTQVRKVGKLVSRNGRNLLNLVNQLLDLSKIESGKLQLQLSRADVMQFIKVNTEAFESLAEMKKLHLSVKIEPNELWADFDPDRLQQVIANLIGNAIKFTPEGGTVTVTARFQENTMLEIEVRDTGIGISEEALPHVFKRFYQVPASQLSAPSQPPPKGEELSAVLFNREVSLSSAENASNSPSLGGGWGEAGRASAGSGIGLAFTDELVKLMGGRIEVESEVGKGSTFRVILPMQAQENGARAALEANSFSPTSRSCPVAACRGIHGN